jgi:hypothetical protein
LTMSSSLTENCYQGGESFATECVPTQQLKRKRA